MKTSRRARTSRSIDVLRHFGLASVLVASLALSACGNEGDDPETEASPAPSVTPAPTATADGADSVDHREIGTFSATGLRPVDEGASTNLKGAKGARGWLEGLGATPETVDEVAEAIETAALTGDETLHGVILSTGCLAPKSWTLVENDGVLRAKVVPDEKEATTTCIAAVTSLAVVAVPNDD